MNNKITFAIEKANIINENPNSKFATVKLDFFASGDNLNDLYVSEDTLMKTADTIKYCPIVWKYDKVLDDVYTHDEEETPCGFVPETSTIETKKLSDGRTMLSTVAYIWKRYTGSLLNIFKRDGGKKPVSVEMIVKDYIDLPNGKKELLDFEYQCITILGNHVTPAIPMASATVLSFASDFEEEFGEEFSLQISEQMKQNAREALEEAKKQNYSTPASISIAKNIIKMDTLTEQLAEELKEYFSDKKNVSLTDYNLHGGEEAEELLKLLEKRNRMIQDKIISFPYKKISDINPALKGIDPPITLAQANEIASQADAIGVDKKKNGWAIAIANFKKTHHVENGKWVKNKEQKMEKEQEDKSDLLEEEKIEENNSLSLPSNRKEEVNMEETEKSMEVQTEEKFEEVQEAPQEEKAKFEIPENMSWLFAEEDEEAEICAAKEQLRSMSPDFAVVFDGLFAKMNKMRASLAKKEEELKAYMSENERLLKAEREAEEAKKAFAVKETLDELESKVVFPEGVRDALEKKAEEYSISDIDNWKIYCKAVSFDFVAKAKTENEEQVEAVGLPFANREEIKKDIWDN